MKRFHLTLLIAVVIIALGFTFKASSNTSTSSTSQVTSSSTQPHRLVSSPSTPATTAPNDVSSSGFQILDFFKKLFSGSSSSKSTS